MLLQRTLLSFIIAIYCIGVAVSQPKSAYGPTRYAQSLWEIAAEIRPNQSVGITQLVFALHLLNPKAFKAGNMNQLKKGVFLTLPDMEKVALIPIKRARHELGRNDESLNTLRHHAKKLRIAKNNKKKWADKMTSLQQKLERIDPDSQQWSVIFDAQETAELKHRKWVAEVNKIRHLLLKNNEPKKAQVALLINKKKIKENKDRENRVKKPSKENIVTEHNVSTQEITPSFNKVSVDNIVSTMKTITASTNPIISPVISPIPTRFSLKDAAMTKEGEQLPTEWAQIDKRTLGMESRLMEIQNKMDQMLDAQQKETEQRNKQIADLQDKLEQANQQLEQKVKQLALTEARMSVLEKVLGDKEKIVLTLRSTLRTAANTMRLQQQENQKLYTRLQELNPNDELLMRKKLDITGSRSLEAKQLEQDDVTTNLNKSEIVTANTRKTEREHSQASNSNNSNNSNNPDDNPDNLSPQQEENVISDAKYQLNDSAATSNLGVFAKNNTFAFIVFLISLLLFTWYVILKWRRRSFFKKRKVVEIKFKPVTKNNGG